MADLKFYCDMDSVLTDFNGGYERLTGIKLYPGMPAFSDFWTIVNKAGARFWYELEWMPDGKILWNYIKKYNPILLSQPSEKKSSRIGKSLWAERELPGTKLIFRNKENKKEFANSNAVLIDDMPCTIKDWIFCGGIGILHTSSENTIKLLKKYNL